MNLQNVFTDKYIQGLGVAVAVWFLAEQFKPSILYDEDGHLHSECFSPELVGVLAGLGTIIYKSTAFGTTAGGGSLPSPQEAAQGVSAEFRAMTIDGL